MSPHFAAVANLQPKPARLDLRRNPCSVIGRARQSLEDRAPISDRPIGFGGETFSQSVEEEPLTVGHHRCTVVRQVSLGIETGLAAVSGTSVESNRCRPLRRTSKAPVDLAIYQGLLVGGGGRI